MARSIHDNYIIGYQVDCVKHEIIFQTEYRAKDESYECTNIIFDGVIAYFLLGDNFSSIILSIDEVSINQILEEYKSEFAEGEKYCWPGAWNTSIETSLEYISQQNVKGWDIFSAYGMAGFIIGKNMKLQKC